MIHRGYFYFNDVGKSQEEAIATDSVDVMSFNTREALDTFQADFDCGGHYQWFKVETIVDGVIVETEIDKDA